ncbi:MAG: DNA-3-methyladenine glycosylase I [bacterium]|nr:DNA-3-methyladenine glycosylase I [bacterium]
MESARCEWCGTEPLYVQYHDVEWGVPVWDDHTLFEFLTLEGAQAGLSWITILRKREGYRRAFANFDPRAVVGFGENDVERLCDDASIVRNRLKIRSTIDNAKSLLEVQDEWGTFASYIWSFVGGVPIQNTWTELGEIPARTPLAEEMSRDLKKRGFRFVGPTIVYAYMQATGMVNDHLVECFRHAEIANLGA